MEELIVKTLLTIEISLQYGGKWYELLRYPTRFEDPLGKCVIATYELMDDTTVSVNNSQITPVENSDKYKLSWGTGEAKQLQV